MHAGFLSFSSRYRAWVRALHQDIEVHLGAGTVWLDEVNLAPGRSWVSGLQEGLTHAERVVLVATPEAFASPWVQNELDAFLSVHPLWKQQGRLQLALLVDTPLPPLLASAQHVDFRECDDGTYAKGLRSLIGALQGLSDPRSFPSLSAGVHAPAAPACDLPPSLRSDLVRVLTPLLNRRGDRTAIATALGLPAASLEGQGSAACAASAALVLSSTAGDAVAAARRVIAHALDQELPSDRADAAEDLRQLDRQLAGLHVAATAIATVTAPPTPAHVPRPVELVHPTGTVPLGSQFYVRRETDDLAEREIAQFPGMVHILGPRQMGKSSLLTRLAATTRAASGGPLVIQLNLQDDFDSTALKQVTPLLVQLAAAMLDAAGLDPEAALEIERTKFSPKHVCKGLVRSKILTAHPEGVLLAMDEVDRVVLEGGCSQDFFEMLRGWHEMGKHDPAWARLRIALCFCTEAHMAPEGVSGSPLDNVGLKCRLRDFRDEEVGRLTELHGMAPDRVSREQLMSSFGGIPYLLRRTLYALAAEGYELAGLSDEAMRCTGPLGDHLERHLRHLHARPDLAAAMREVLARSTCADARVCRALEGAGLVRRDPDGRVTPRCGLYRQFFRAHLS